MKICVFNNDVMVLTLPDETTKDEISNRADPSICIIDHPDEENIEVVLQCNTLKSVDKFRNILDSYHSREKADLVRGLSELDNDFMTVIYSKKKTYNFGQSPKYEKDLIYQSRSISEKEIDQIFNRVDEIRVEGIEWKIRDGRRDPPELPAIGIAGVSITRDENCFKRKLEQIKPIYVSTLSVKTQSELRKAHKLTSKWREEERHSQCSRSRTRPSPRKLSISKPQIILCVNCKNRKYSREEYDQNRFCRNCGMRLSFVRQ
jgi:hypothetical protein